MSVINAFAFPQTAEELKSRESRARAKASTLSLEAQRLKHQSQATEAFARMIHSLATSWSEPDPGKYGPSIFLLDKHGNRVCAEELLPEGVVRFSREQWSALSWQERDSQQRNVVRGYPVIPFADVMIGTHPKQGIPLPILEYYIQTEDGPDGDEWQKSRVMLDFEHCEILVLSTERSEYRF